MEGELDDKWDWIISSFCRNRIKSRTTIVLLSSSSNEDDTKVKDEVGKSETPRSCKKVDTSVRRSVISLDGADVELRLTKS